MKVRKRPVVLDAIQFTGNNADEVKEFIGVAGFRLLNQYELTHNGGALRYPVDGIVALVWDRLHSTWVGVKSGDWIMIGTEGESWPVDDAVFTKTYDVLDNAEDSAA